MQVMRSSLLMLASFALLFSPPLILAQTRLNPAAARPKNVPYRFEAQDLEMQRRVDPIAPSDPNRGRLSSNVFIRVIINERGEVWVAEFVFGGDPSFNDEALDAVLRWRFKPKLFEGQPVPVETVVTVGPLPTALEKVRSDAEPPRREPIHTGPNVAESMLIRRVEPAYPESARESRVSGMIILSVTVNEIGRVYEARVIRGHPLLNRAALEAVLQWLYRPLQIGGEAMPFVATVTLTFNHLRSFCSPDPNTGQDKSVVVREPSLPRS
jgi:TonB family protein